MIVPWFSSRERLYMETGRNAEAFFTGTRDASKLRPDE